MKKSHFLAVLLLAGPLLATMPAHAAEGAKTNDDDPTINQQGVNINRILRVLQANPDQASDSCINALKEMHKAQDVLGKEEGSDSEHNEDLAVARDVLSSEMEDVTNMCGADARTLCRDVDSSKTPNLAKACTALPPLDE
ncbi:hypothetical protein [Gluconobacter morbifer]|uniref:Secreted protein n=1 Tax=Gluconobacter morbifer G707 TaxID=1088869 RepID=G6XJM3_9PROT|nr:hypothetical protein [Gluconobacter morbifer]EHH67835.1 hypothetical protein GMO_16020 [Gluconobacter morbifer G707]